MVAKGKISSDFLFGLPPARGGRNDALEAQIHKHLRPVRKLVFLNELEHFEAGYALAIEPGNDSGKEIVSLGGQNRRLRLDGLPQLGGERGSVQILRQLQPVFAIVSRN